MEINEYKSHAEILESEYSFEFDKLRQSRVKASYYKYGPARINFGEGLVDAIKSAEMCIEKFKTTGNTEYLCDVANYMMFRYMFPKKGEYFRATDSNESAGIAGFAINEIMAKAGEDSA